VLSLSSKRRRTRDNNIISAIKGNAPTTICTQIMERKLSLLFH
jgi:hypothetical protein